MYGSTLEAVRNFVRAHPGRSEPEVGECRDEGRQHRWPHSSIDHGVEILAYPSRFTAGLECVEHHHLAADEHPILIVGVDEIAQGRPQIIAVRSESRKH